MILLRCEGGWDMINCLRKFTPKEERIAEDPLRVFFGR